MNNKPLMFINSISSLGGKEKEQIFDSRKTINIKKEEKEQESLKKEIQSVNEKEIYKLNKMIKLNNYDKLVVCRLYTPDAEVECIPISIDNNKLKVRKTETVIEEIDLNNIINVEIVKI